MLAIHLCGGVWAEHTHCTRLLDPSVTLCGARGVLAWTSHWAARPGCRAASELQRQGRRPEHTGHL